MRMFDGLSWLNSHYIGYRESVNQATAEFRLRSANILWQMNHRGNMTSRTRKTTLVACMLAAMTTATLAHGSETKAEDGKLTIDSLPFPLELQLGQGAASVENKGFLLRATKGTDLYANSDGTKSVDNTPRVLFQPVGDFIFSARIDAAFKHAFDGGALIVYSDKTHWAKLLFEFAPSGAAGVSSTVTKGVGDDAHHGVVNASSVYLKVVRRENMFVFYTSSDGKKWNMVRSFGMPAGLPTKIGFSSQSPVGPEFSAHYSDVRFRNATFKDFWQGE